MNTLTGTMARKSRHHSEHGLTTMTSDGIGSRSGPSSFQKDEKGLDLVSPSGRSGRHPTGYSMRGCRVSLGSRDLRRPRRVVVGLHSADTRHQNLGVERGLVAVVYRIICDIKRFGDRTIGEGHTCRRGVGERLLIDVELTRE